MALTTAQQVRLRIQDQPTVADRTLYGDGLLDTFPLPERNLTSGTAFVPLAAGWSATGATFNATGSVAFAAVISANSAFRARYVHSTFSDEEIDLMITAGGGSVNGAALEAVQTLMFDGLKRASWAAPDGTSYDDTAAMRLLNDLYGRLKEEQAEQAALNGGISEWGLHQQDW
jgi:hypothetical protein